MPRAEIFGPQRRSIVSSIPTTTGPSGTNTATSQCSRARASDRPDQRARLSTPWKRAKSVPSPSEHRQHGGYGAPSRSQNGAGHQNQDTLPGRFGEEGGERRQPVPQDRRGGGARRAPAGFG